MQETNVRFYDVQRDEIGHHTKYYGAIGRFTGYTFGKYTDDDNGEDRNAMGSVQLLEVGENSALYPIQQGRYGHREYGQHNTEYFTGPNHDFLQCVLIDIFLVKIQTKKRDRTVQRTVERT